MDLISVITTVKNGERYLLEMLLSVYNQTYRPIEHVIVDDNSTDNSIAIITSFQKKHPDYRIKLIKTEGLGRGKALNFAVSNANGKWIAIIDADDIWHPDKLNKQNHIVSNTNIDVLCTKAKLFNSSDKISFTKNLTGDWEQINNSLFRSNQLSHSSVLIRKELCFYDEKRLSQFDFELWLRLYTKGFKLAICKDELSFHRIHDGQSFEGLMGKVYNWRSFKLKSHYSFKSGNIKGVMFNFAKLLFDLSLSKSLRMKIREKLIR